MATRREMRREDIKSSVANAMALPGTLLVFAIAIAMIIFLIFQLPSIGRAYNKFRLDLCIGGYFQEGEYVGTYDGREICFTVDKSAMEQKFNGYVTQLKDPNTGEVITDCLLTFYSQSLYCGTAVNYRPNPFKSYCTHRLDDGTYQVGDNKTWFTFHKA